MPAAIATTDEFVACLRKSRLVADHELNGVLAAHPELTEPTALAGRLKFLGHITDFQAGQLLRGRHKGFVLGKYKLLDRIGLGGMGQVYLAEHTTMRRRVAVKVLPPDRSDNPFATERFLREARAAAAVEHPNLTRVYDIEQDDEVQFLVMEYIDGVSLHDLVARRGPVSPERAANYLYQIAAGLSALHSRALVHRDIKPANVVLDRNGLVRVLDLGLVRSEIDDDALTRGEGAKIVGTADYLAPEQAIDCSKVDSRADIYGLGATAYFLLAGRPPFVAEKVSQKLIAHQIQTAKPLTEERPGTPPELAAVVHKMLAKQAADRYQSAVEVMAALEPWALLPLPVPNDADFPERAGWALPASIAMSFAANSGSMSGSNSGGNKVESRPIMRSVTGRSVIRIGPTPGTPASSGLGNQTTKATAGEETSTTHRRATPPMPTPAPFSLPGPVVTTVAAARTMAEPTDFAALFATAPSTSARMKAPTRERNWTTVVLAIVALVVVAGSVWAAVK